MLVRENPLHELEVVDCCEKDIKLNIKKTKLDDRHSGGFYFTNISDAIFLVERLNEVCEEVNLRYVLGFKYADDVDVSVRKVHTEHERPEDFHLDNLKILQFFFGSALATGDTPSPVIGYGDELAKRCDPLLALLLCLRELVL